MAAVARGSGPTGLCLGRDAKVGRWHELRDHNVNPRHTGDGSSNADYPYLGTDVLAVANATVVKTRDGMPNEQPFAQPAKYVKTGQDYVGNSVVLKIGPNRYAIYAHLQPGSRSRSRSVTGSGPATS